ncbi:MAG TPA: DEAD/DEAH box helicase [Acidimicrobiales bacterium]
MSPALALDGQHTITLRGYQEECLAAIDAAEGEGVRRQLIVLPTGGGKTIIFTSFASRRGERTLILAHRDELIAQAAGKVRLTWPDADLGIVKAERNETWAQDVVVASIQSLSPQRIARLGAFGVVVVDEAHHCGAASYARVLDGLGCGPDDQSRRADGPLLLGWTATPDRADGKGLDHTFERIVYSKDILWMIRAGYLCDVRAREVRLANLDLSKVKVRQGDYAEGELGAALTAVNAPRHIVRAWKEHAADRQTAVFVPTIANASEVAAEFAANGIRSACVSGATLEDRRRMLRDFDAGRIQVLTNAQILTEGWDSPPCSCIVMARPTKSRGLYAQIIGRGLRPHPGKPDCIVLDLVGDSERLDLCSVPSLFGVPKSHMVTKSASRAVADVEAAAEAEAARSAARPTAPDARLVARDVELFRQVQAQGKVAWGRVRGGGYAVSLGRSSVVLDPNGTDAAGGDLYNVVVIDSKGRADKLMERVPLSLAQGIAEDHIRKTVPGSGALVNKAAPWRGRAPSPKQLDAARRLKITVPMDEHGRPLASAGEVSEMIDARLAEFRKRKVRT